MVDRGASLLAEASRQVRSCEELLLLVQTHDADPKLILYAAQHGLRAARAATETIRPDGPTVEGIGSLTGTVTSAEEMKKEFIKITAMVAAHRDSPTTFQRDGKIVFVDETFSSVQMLSVQQVARFVDIVKQYVHEVGRTVMLGIVVR